MRLNNICCFTLLSIFFGCSEDYNKNIAEDIIIGKWKLFKQFESNTEVDINMCDATWVIEFKADNAIDSYESEPHNYPDECPTKTPQSGWNWVNRGNNQYEIRCLEEQGIINIFYRDGGHLVRELHNGITKVIYKPITSFK